MNKKGIIGFLVVSGILITLGFFLFIREYEKETPETANPASTYCIAQGHRLEIREGKNGQVGYCISSDNQECKEWDFYRKECSFETEKKCVPASCCHASSCVLESEAPNCKEVFCTMECRGGTIDCEAGYCSFIDGKCEVIWNE